MTWMGTLGSRNLLLAAGLALLSGASGACGADKHDNVGDGPDGQVPDAATGSDAASPGNGMDGGLKDAGPVLVDATTGLPDGSPFTTNPQGQVLCGTSPCACSNGTDDDADGLVDLADPECVSSWDNDEGSFATGIPGDNRDTACQDCFFDGNSGSGDDGCRVATSCLVNPADDSSGRGSCETCAANDQCRTTCQVYTPNGCDCFGCCTVQLGSGIQKSVLLAAGCNIDGSDTSGCTACVPSTTCSNPCGECELCPGKTLADLPPSCASGSDAGVLVPRCEDGQATCSANTACGAGELCQFGCCQLAPIVL